MQWQSRICCLVRCPLNLKSQIRTGHRGFHTGTLRTAGSRHVLSKSLPPASSKVGPYNSWLGHGECESYRRVPLDMESHGLYRMCLLVGHRSQPRTFPRKACGAGGFSTRSRSSRSRSSRSCRLATCHGVTMDGTELRLVMACACHSRFREKYVRAISTVGPSKLTKDVQETSSNM